MRAPKSPFECSLSKRVLFFAYLMCCSASGAKALKNVSAICHIQFQWKATEHFWNRIKKMWIDRTKIALEKKVFFCLYAKLATVKIWEQSNKFPLTCTCSSLKCPLLVKKLFWENSAEKIVLRKQHWKNFSCFANKLHPQTQSTGFSDNWANQRLESLLPLASWWNFPT